MAYLTHPADIRSTIAQLTNHSILWVDTETADWWTSNPKLSLIQVLAHPDDRSGDYAYVLDVLDQPTLAECFIEQIMKHDGIEKVFHNASYDLRFLGNVHAQNVTCTLKIARKISLAKLGTPDRKLKTLAKVLCQFADVDSEQQSSNWGRRPLSSEQLLYAHMDTVYVAQVHQHLLKLSNSTLVDSVRRSRIN